MANELNSNQIAQILPHRFPFALVDRITDYEPGQWAKGRKCVSVNEQFFCGHFPQEHVMPGVLILEAMAQVGAVAVLSLPEKYRLPVHLFYYEGYSIAETAAVLGRRESTVRAQLTRARAMLREKLEVECI